MQFFQVFDAPSEIAALLPADLLRAAVTRQPDNVATLMTLCVDRLSDLLASPTFPSASSGVSFNFSSWVGSSSTTAAQINSTREFLNAARVLCRLLPVLFERLQTQTSHAIFPEDQANRDAAADWVHQLLWKGQVVEAPTEDQDQRNQSAQFVIDDEDEEDDPETAKPHSTNRPQVRTIELPSLGERL